MSNLCAYCDDAAVTTVDGEPMCQSCFNDWWNDNTIKCDDCGTPLNNGEGYKVGNDTLCFSCKCNADNHAQMVMDETRFYQLGAF